MTLGAKRSQVMLSDNPASPSQNFGQAGSIYTYVQSPPFYDKPQHNIKKKDKYKYSQ